MSLEPSGRPEKTTPSIIEKLRRESIRPSQMQDIAGCRVVVSNPAEQDRVVASLQECFRESDVVDRRQQPSHGYRAVHVIVRKGGRSVEVQVRTGWQHLWAQYSENLSDSVDASIKYGGGPASVAEMLLRTSDLIGRIETREQKPEGIDLVDSLILLLTALGGIIKTR